VARVLVYAEARDDLERLILTHSLSPGRRDRVKRSLGRLRRFPLTGRAIEEGHWSDYRVILGPWRWLVVLYRYDADEDVVMVASMEDGRSSSAARAG